MKKIAPLFALGLILLAGCDKTMPPPDEQERQQILEDAPEIFSVDEERATLIGLDEFYLGQPNDEALARLDELCEKTMEYKRGDFGENAWFRGCVLKERRGEVTSVRIGFWPKLDDRVSTLEIKRAGVELEEVRERFRDLSGELSVDLLRAGLLEMRGEQYQVMADIDDGKDQPVHIAFGYTHDHADTLKAQD